MNVQILIYKVWNLSMTCFMLGNRDRVRLGVQIVLEIFPIVEAIEILER